LAHISIKLSQFVLGILSVFARTDTHTRARARHH